LNETVEINKDEDKEKQKKNAGSKSGRASISGLLKENKEEGNAAEDIANARVTDVESILETDEKDLAKKKKDDSTS